MKHIAIIPARSGSKGLKDKNIKSLNGKPLMAYTIESALQSGLYDEIHVSTDSEIYALVAREYGGSVPFLRSIEKSTDEATSWDVVREVIFNYKVRNQKFDLITLLQPTSPLRTGEDIRNAKKILDDKHANAVVSLCETEHSPLWCNTLPDNSSLEHFIKKEVLQFNRQKLDTYYRINGAVYMFYSDYFFSHETIYEKACYGYIMDKYSSVDIDDDYDFLLAEFLLNKKTGIQDKIT